MSINKIIKVLVISMVLVLVSIPTINTFRGEGLTFTSIIARFESKQFFKHIEKKNFEKAAKIIGLIDDSNSNRKSKFISDMEMLFTSSDLTLVSYENIEFKTEDRHTSGSVELVFSENHETYGYLLMLSVQDGHLCPMYIDQVSTNIEMTKRAESLASQLDAIWSTYKAY